MNQLWRTASSGQMGQEGWARTGRPVGSAADRGPGQKAQRGKPGPGKSSHILHQAGDTRPLPGQPAPWHPEKQGGGWAGVRPRVQGSCSSLALPTLPAGLLLEVKGRRAVGLCLGIASGVRRLRSTEPAPQTMKFFLEKRLEETQSCRRQAAPGCCLPSHWVGVGVGLKPPPEGLLPWGQSQRGCREKQPIPEAPHRTEAAASSHAHHHSLCKT